MRRSWLGGTNERQRRAFAKLAGPISGDCALASRFRETYPNLYQVHDQFLHFSASHYHAQNERSSFSKPRADLLLWTDHELPDALSHLVTREWNERACSGQRGSEQATNRRPFSKACLQHSQTVYVISP